MLKLWTRESGLRDVGSEVKQSAKVDRVSIFGLCVRADFNTSTPTSGCSEISSNSIEVQTNHMLARVKL